MKTRVSYNIQRGVTNISESTMSIFFPHESVTKKLLSVCHRICQHQSIRSLHIEGVHCKDLSEPDVFTLSITTKSLIIRNCIFSMQTLSHLIQQLNNCSKLSILFLSFTSVRGLFPNFLPDPHLGLPELEKLNLTCAALDKDDLNHVTHLVRIQKLPGLQELCLDDNSLSKIEVDVEHLIEACVTCHKRKLGLSLKYNNLSQGLRVKGQQ